MCCLISAYSTSADCMGNQHNVALFPLKSVNVDAGDVTFHTLLHRADVPEPKAVSARGCSPRVCALV